MQYVGIDWTYRRAAWCAKTGSGEICAQGAVPADVDGLAKLVLAELCRRDLVPALWVPSLSDQELRERLHRRAHLIRLRRQPEPGVRRAEPSGDFGSRCGCCASVIR